LFFQLREEIVYLVLAVSTGNYLEFHLVKAAFAEGGAVIFAHLLRLVERVHDLAAAKDGAPYPGADDGQGDEDKEEHNPRQHGLNLTF